MKSSLLAVMIFTKIIKCIKGVKSTETELQGMNVSQISKEDILINYSELHAELQDTRLANQYLSRLLQCQYNKTDRHQKQLSKYLFYTSHNMRGPLARILGIVNLFDHNAIREQEIELLLCELKNSASELDEEIKGANIMLNRDMEICGQKLTGSVINNRPEASSFNDTSNMMSIKKKIAC